MCTTCGCGGNGARIEGQEHAHGHLHGLRRRLQLHPHGEPQEPARGGRMIRLEQDLLAKNNAYAADNRRLWREQGIFALNLVSSPGSGKTTLLTATIQALQPRLAIAVIEGDQQTAFDADRIRAAGARAIQINTGKGCHLDAHLVGHAAQALELVGNSVLMIENVGNLVCPAGFDLGEAHKVVILSVTEGEDKPYKYPDMFAAADLMILNKIDLLPYLAFDTDACLRAARIVNPGLQVLQLSATTGEGLGAWTDWIEAGLKQHVEETREAQAEASGSTIHP